MRTTVSIAALLLAALCWRRRRRPSSSTSSRPTPPPRSCTSPPTRASSPRRLGIGRAPAISPDGRWVAFITVPNERRHARHRRAEAPQAGLAALRHALQADRLAALLARLGAARGDRQRPAHPRVRHRQRQAARGRRRATSAATRGRPTPSASSTARPTGEDFQADSDLYVARAMGGADPDRLTRSKDAVNPVWGAGGDLLRPLHRARGRRARRTTSSPSTRRPRTSGA